MLNFICTITVILGAIGLYIVFSKREKKGTVEFIRADKESEKGGFALVSSRISKWISYVAFAVGGILCVCAVFQKKTSEIIYTLSMAFVFLLPAAYWLARCLRWQIRFSEETIFFRGAIGKTRALQWREVRSVKLICGYGVKSREAKVFAEIGKRELRFSLPEDCVEEFSEMIKRHPNVKFISKNRGKGALDFKI